MKFEIPEQYKNSSGIYSITNMVNGKRLIGQTINFRKRFNLYKGYLKRGAYANRHLQFSYNKYGSDNFKMELMCLCPVKDLTDKETYFCKLYNTMNNKLGYNKKDPMLHGKYSDDAKKRMSMAQMGNKNCLGYKRSEETKNKHAILRRGYRFSEESIKKMSDSQSGKKLSEEHKLKIGIARRGQKHSEETKKRMSSAHHGNHYRLGYKDSEETKKRKSQSLTGRRYPLGYNHGNQSSLGQKHSEETKKRMSEAHKLQWQKRRLLMNKEV